MNPEERRAIRLLSRCTFPVASWDKRFVRDMAAKLQAELEHVENTVELSERQHNCLMEKTHRYRRQHGRCDCMKCLGEAMKRDQPWQTALFGETGPE